MSNLNALFDPQHLQAYVVSVLRLCAWLALLVALFGPLEMLFAVRRRRLFSRRLLHDLGYYFLSGLVPGLLLAFPVALVAVAAHAVMPDSLQAAVAALPLWLRIVIGFVIGEIGFYWGHRWAHEIPLLWRFHAIHHSAEEIYFLISSRAHPIDNVFIRICGLVPAYLLGVASPLTPSGSLVPALIVVGATTWGFFIHSNLRWRLGPLEWLVATPRFHHWHHTQDGLRNRNYASMLPWIDRVFGTHHLPPKAWPERYGIDTPLPASVVSQLVHPFRPGAFASPAGGVDASNPRSGPRLADAGS